MGMAMWGGSAGAAKMVGIKETATGRPGEGDRISGRRSGLGQMLLW